jgi:hypothetical protein
MYKYKFIEIKNVFNTHFKWVHVNTEYTNIDFT